MPTPYVLNRAGTTIPLNIDLTLSSQTLADGTQLTNVTQINFTGGTGADTVLGGAYGDTLNGGGGGDSFVGGAGNDLLIDTTGYQLFGGSGDDLIQVFGAGAVDGGAGYDILQIRASTTFVAGSITGIEEVDVDSGFKLDVSALSTGLNIKPTAGATGGITVTGTSGSDTITGGPGSNTIDGMGGNDLLIGGPMKDVITAGPGFDTVFAGGGDDTIQVKRGTGPDQIDGGAGNDLLNADYTTSIVNLHLDISTPAVTQTLGDGATTIVNIEQLKIFGGQGADTFVGGAFADSLNGGLGDDVLQGNGGNDQINGGDGYDVAVYSGSHDQYTVTNLGSGTFTVSGNGEGTDTLTGIETLRFSDGDTPIGGYNSSAVFWGSPNGTHDLVSSTPVPDGLGAATGTGFTNTGLTRAPDGTWWLANEGQADATDTTYTPSLVHLSADFTTKLGEIALGGKIRSLQGLTYDTTTNQLLVASLSEHIVRVVNLNGTLAQTITLATSVSPNGLTYDPTLDAAVVGRSNGSPNNGEVDWYSMSTGSLLKSVTLPVNPDHLYFDPNQGTQGTLYYSYGPSGVGAVGTVTAMDVASGATLGSYVLPEADAIEGIYIANGVLYANNDAYFHRGSDPVNSVLTFDVTPPAVIVNHASATQSETVDLSVHSETLSDGTKLVGVPRIFYEGGSAADVISGGAYDDVLVGSGGADTITGRGGDDRLVGMAGNDLFIGGAGNDSIEGGDGTDTAVYSGARANYAVAQLGTTGIMITDTRVGSPDGVDVVRDVENFKFSDGTFTYAQTVQPGVTEVDLSNLTLPENSAAGTVVGKLSAVFAGGSTTFTFSLTDNDGGRFAISSGNLVVAPNAVLDYETAPSQNVTVRATAANGSYLDQTFTLGLTDVDEAPTAIHLQNPAPIPKNTTTAVRVGDIVVDDPDTNPAFRVDTFTVSDQRFQVVSGGLYLKAGQTVDWTQSSISVNVTVTEGAFSLTQGFTIPIVAAPPTTGITLSNTSIPENSPAGAAVGALTGVDSNNGTNFTFSLTNDDAGRFVLQGAQVLVAPNAGLDFETGPTQQIAVHGVSTDGETFDQTFTINVTDVDEAPTDITLSNTAPLIDHTTTQTRLADLVVADPDTNPAFRVYTFTVDDPRFVISNGSLYLKSGQTIDFNTQPIIPINITVNDQAFSFTKEFDLQVTSTAQPTVVDRTGTTLGLFVDATLPQQTLADGTQLGAIQQIRFLGGTGADTVIGGLLADTLVGGGGADSLLAGAGADSLVGGAGATLMGGDGNDSLQVTGAPGLVDGGNGVNSLHVSGSITFNAGSVTNIQSVVVDPGLKEDFSKLTNGLVISAGAGTTGITVVGTAGSDSLLGNAGSDSFDGSGGSDTINGGAGADKITGGSGHDSLVGGDGNDLIEIKRGTGPDDVDGGAGVDTLNADFGKNATGLNLDFSNPATVQHVPDGTTIVNIEQLKLTGGAGSDQITGGALADVIGGYTGNDTLNGGAGNDTLSGDDGNDVLYGGLGNDLMTGGAGADVFAPGIAGWGADTVTDFVHGTDKIDLRGFGVSFSDLTVTHSGTTTMISLAGQGSFTLLNDSGTTTAGDFIFV